ncbi:MAG: ribbon-helix-helix domain-containing protein [Rhizobiaceae bacterium]
MNSLEIKKSAFETRYRAIGSADKRRGIRLENCYWLALEEISIEKKVPISALVEEIDRISPGRKNLTSMIRVFCQEWYKNKIERFESISNEKTIKNLIFSCPSPALALSLDRRLHSFNEAFLNYVTDRLPIPGGSLHLSNLRLTLDIQLEVLLDQLLSNENQTIPVGIAIGVQEKRIRDVINVVRAPILSRDILLGYFKFPR